MGSLEANLSPTEISKQPLQDVVTSRRYTPMHIYVHASIMARENNDVQKLGKDIISQSDAASGRYNNVVSNDIGNRIRSM